MVYLSTLQPPSGLKKPGSLILTVTEDLVTFITVKFGVGGEVSGVVIIILEQLL